MKRYTFWNNKGGTGKTSLCFQCLVRYAERHQADRILVIDMCPQANLSELLLGGLIGNGASNLGLLYNMTPRKSIGGYFHKRIISPFTMPQIVSTDFISQPHQYNNNIPGNIDLLAGDNLLELQSTFISSAANMNLPNQQSAYALVMQWINDFLQPLGNEYDVIFIDCNPSFSVYTQIAITSSENLIIPVMADDSSRRALQNVLSLIYGYNVPVGYQRNSYNTIIHQLGIPLPKIFMILKNRITQYMGAASGYRAVLAGIDTEIANAYAANPNIFSTNFLIKEVRDFQSTGVIAFAEAMSFSVLNTKPLNHTINGNPTTLTRTNINNHIVNIDDIVNCL